MTNKVIATLLIADRKINDFMQCMDLRHNNKWYVTVKNVTFSTTSEINESYFKDMIEKSRTLIVKNKVSDFWIPCIIHEGKQYVHPNVLEITDGDNTMFITENLPNRHKYISSY